MMARIVNGENLLAHSPTDAINNDNGRPIFIVHENGDTRSASIKLANWQRLPKQKELMCLSGCPMVLNTLEPCLTLQNTYQQDLVSFFKNILKNNTQVRSLHIGSSG